MAIKNIKYRKKGGYKSRYSIGGIRKYQNAGMYGANTVAAAGQGANIQDTANIVYSETDPKIQEERLKAYDQQKLLLQQQSMDTASKLEQEELNKQQELQMSAAKRAQKSQAIDSAVGTGVKYGAKGIDKISGYLAKRAAKKAAEKAAIETGKTSAMLASQVTQQATQAGGKELAQNIGSGAASYGFKTGAEQATQAVVKEGAEQVGKTVAKEVAEEGAKEVGKVAVGEAAKSSVNISPYATAAALVGNIGGAFVDDQDETTWTGGEATFDILGDAGEYAGYGATLGSIVPGVGNLVGAGVGALVGAGKSIWTNLAAKKKAKREKATADREMLEKKTKYNQELGLNIAASKRSVRAGEIKQKTYSGYDLGRNVVARRGGMRMGMPRYGYAS
tara:strand:+ start:1700 stop:2872 length:1173 start_codon:yes stop_codon:yes gene_type:complete